MIRLTFTKKDLNQYFGEIKTSNKICWSEIAFKIGINERTLYDWRNGRTSIPQNYIGLFNKKFSVNSPSPKETIDDIDIKRKSASLGGYERVRLYGNPGTSESRRKGGLKSIESHRLNKNSPFVRKSIVIPKFSNDFAEFIGIILGDGGVNLRQVKVSLNKVDDKKYSQYVKKLIEKLFKIQASISYPKSKKVLHIVVSRTALVELLTSMKIYPRNKVKYQVSVPEWIYTNIEFKKRCIRGLLDTDGCFYIDKHIIKNKLYKNAGINFSNRSIPLINFFKNTLIELGFSPTQSQTFAVFLRQKNDILRYFSEIGTSNQKHLNKFNAFFREWKSTEEVITAPIRNRMVG